MIGLQGRSLIIFICSYFVSLVVMDLFLLVKFKFSRVRRHDIWDQIVFPFVGAIIFSRLVFVVFNYHLFKDLSWSSNFFINSDNSLALNYAKPWIYFNVYEGIDPLSFTIYILYKGLDISTKKRKLPIYASTKSLLLVLSMNYIFSIIICMCIEYSSFSIAMYLLGLISILLLITYFFFEFLKAKKFVSILFSYLVLVFSLVVFIMYNYIGNGEYTLDFVYVVYFVAVIYSLVRYYKTLGTSSEKSQVEKIKVVMRDWK